MSDVFDGVAVPPAGKGVLFFERDDELFAVVVFSPGVAATGIRFNAFGEARVVSGEAVLEPTDPFKGWSPVTREELLAGVAKARGDAAV